MKKAATYALAGAVLAAIAAVAFFTMRDRSDKTVDRLLLLVPDKVELSDPRIAMWVDAGNEEGLHVVPIHDSDFLRPFQQKSEYAGVILPDSVHKEASDLLVNAIRQQVAGGGKLMLVYDAATLSLQGRYPAGESRLSDLSCVKYAMYNQLKDDTTRWSKIHGTREHFDQLGVPPGKYYPFQNVPPDQDVELRRYEYGDLEYPSFVTSGGYAGNVLLHSDAGVVAGECPYQKGSVLFVNLPLGYLKGNTDGLPLHGFLNYFAAHTVALPRLLPVPDGIGGLTLNWHIDSNASIKPLQEMQDWRILQQGPYSVHITAGPDAMDIGDHRGFDLDHNPISQEVLHNFENLGHSIGSHGGWIHDYFASHVSTGKPPELEPFLTMNKASLERATGRPVVEYSAPDGNQPQWVTEWLEAHGFIAYYFTGDSGMGPTQGYRDGKREGQNIWAFPMLHLNRAAAFEEFSKLNYTQAEIEAWLEEITNFSVSHHAVRLVYFHPPGVLPYRPIIRQWLTKTGAMKSEGRFRWYTMTDLATFLNSRRQVSWKVSHHDAVIRVDATHPATLEHFTWVLPPNKYSQPKILQGSATITQTSEGWLLVAGKGKTLQFEVEVRSQ